MKPFFYVLLLSVSACLVTGCGSEGGSSDALENASQDEIQEYMDMVRKSEGGEGEDEIGKGE